MGPTKVGGWIGSKWISTTTPGLSSFAVPFFNFNIHVRLHFVVQMKRAIWHSCDNIEGFDMTCKCVRVVNWKADNCICCS